MASVNPLKIVSKLSLGFVLVLIWGFMFLRADLLFPTDTAQWKEMILVYIVFTSFIFSWDTITNANTERSLFRVSFFKKFPVFLISALITLVILVILGLFIKHDSLSQVILALGGISVGVLILHAFTVSILEELVFRGWVVENLKSRGIGTFATAILQAIIFAVFHFTMNRELMTIVFYIPLGLIFLWVKNKYSPNTNMANAGTHFAYNLWILGLFT